MDWSGCGGDDVSIWPNNGLGHFQCGSPHIVKSIRGASGDLAGISREMVTSSMPERRFGGDALFDRTDGDVGVALLES